MIGQAGRWTQTPSTTHLQPINWNPHFCITLNFWWSAGLSDGHKPHLPTLSNQKNEILIFGLCSTSDDQPGWLMGTNPIRHPSPAKNMKCSFMDFVQLLMISRADQWTQTPSANPLQPKKWNAHFSITINFWFRPDWSMDSNPIHHPSATNKMKCLFLDYAQHLMIGWAGWLTQTPSGTRLQSKNEILIFGLCSTSNDQPGWSMDSNPICQPSPAKKVKCLFLYYNQLLI